MAYLTILYDEPSPSTYSGISMTLEDKPEPIVFNTGNPTVDLFTAAKVAACLHDTVRCSSTLDHFAMDGGELRDQGDHTPEDITLALKAARAFLGE